MRPLPAREAARVRLQDLEQPRRAAALLRRVVDEAGRVGDALPDALRGGHIGHFVGGLAPEDLQLLLDIRLHDDRRAHRTPPARSAGVLPL